MFSHFLSLFFMFWIVGSVVISSWLTVLIFKFLMDFYLKNSALISSTGMSHPVQRRNASAPW